MPSGFDPNTSILAGVDTATLLQWLADAQAAYAQLATGTKEVTVIITGGGQHREVTYAKPSIGDLTQWIKLLQAQLGLVPGGRSAIAVTY